jgi:hypothetical protein
LVIETDSISMIGPTDLNKNTPDFLKQLQDTGEPVVLTINGNAELVVQDAEIGGPPPSRVR